MTVTSADLPAFVDTNVVVYAHDVDEGGKHQRAQTLLAELQARDAIVVSVQVLNEFYVRTTRPRPEPLLTHDEADSAIRDALGAWTVLPLTPEATVSALGAVNVHGLSFWDALIWATAKEHELTIIYTEDFQHDRVVEGVRFVNPFLAAS